VAGPPTAPLRLGSGLNSAGRVPCLRSTSAPSQGSQQSADPMVTLAASTGRRMHRSVQFHTINRPIDSALQWEVDPPEPGNLPSDSLKLFAKSWLNTQTLRSPAGAAYGMVMVGYMRGKQPPRSLRQETLPAKRPQPLPSQVLFPPQFSWPL
jgi:hypothetical protein